MPRKTDGIEFEIHPRPTKGEDGTFSHPYPHSLFTLPSLLRRRGELAKGVITRDKKGFKDFDIPVMTPAEFVEKAKE